MLLTALSESFADLTWVTESGGTMSFGEKRAEKARAALQRAKKLPLNRWLFALGIPSIGENTSKEISRLFRSVIELINDIREYGDKPHILKMIEAGNKDAPELKKFSISSHLGPVSAKALIDYATNMEGEGLATLAAIEFFGVKSDNYDPNPTASDDKPLFGKTFCITGTLSVGRDEVKALIESKGGKVSGSVSKKLDYLVAGDDCGSKLTKAQDLGVQILTEAALREML